MRPIFVATLALAGGCSFSKVDYSIDAGHGSGSGSGSGSDPDGGNTVGDAPPDAPEIARPLYAMSGGNLYAIDVDQKTSTEVGPVTDGGADVGTLGGLAWNGASLVGLDSSGGTLYMIDPTTGNVTSSKPLDTDGLGGLTVIPKNEVGNAEPLYLAASGDTIYRIAPGTGTTTQLGQFANGATFRSDLAWVHGNGLFVTLQIPMGNGGPTTTPGGIELAKIDPMNPNGQQDLRTGYDNINGLSGYRGTLWGVSQGGNVYAANMTTGALTLQFGGGPAYTEAAQ